MHARAQIRAALVSRLTGLATTGARAFKARTFSMVPEDMPGLIVYTNNEPSADASIGYPRVQHREVSVSVEAYGKTAGAVDDLLDQMALEIEKAIGADPTLGGVANDCGLTATECDLANAEQNVGVVRLLYTAKYNVRENAPDVLL